MALADDRSVAADGSVAPVGNTVDLTNASYTNSIGDAELAVVWQDPEYDPAASAFCYARVLEIPTPRWSTYDAVSLGLPLRDDLPATIQERGWSSPIWVTP